MNDFAIDECFAELIKKNSWYKGSLYNRKSAAVHKKLFLAQKLPYELKKMYLQNAGYEIIQSERWKKTN